MMNKIIITVAVLCASFNFFHCDAITKAELLQIMVSGHTRAFGKDELLLSGIDITESNKWYEVIKEVRDFVKTKVPSSSLNKDVDVLSQASTDLINTIKMLRATQFNKKPLAFKKDAVEKALAPLQARQKEVKKILSNTKKAPLLGEKTYHKEAREIVNNCADFLEATYAKIFREWKKLLAA